MASWIDWHSHHTSAEVAATFANLSGKNVKIDDFDSPDFRGE